MGVLETQSEETLERVRSSISPESLRAQLERICHSDTFERHANAKKVLRYLVDCAIERHVPTPREIARKALGNKHQTRGPAHLRVEMRTLRKKLHEYYTKEAKENDIWLEIPERQYNVFWKHSPKTLLGQTEFGSWVLWSSKLTRQGAQRAAETSRKFWPHLASVFPVCCAEDFDATLDEGKITLPETIKMFFDSVGNHHLFITSFDRSEIRIYPLNVWLEEWARIKASEAAKTDLAVWEYWGQSAEIENKTEISIHPKLLNRLNLPESAPFPIKLSFHPDGFIAFDVPKPSPRPPRGEYNLYALSFAPSPKERYYSYILVPTEKDNALRQALRGDEIVELESYGYVVAQGIGSPSEGMLERLRIKYHALLITRSSA